MKPYPIFLTGLNRRHCIVIGGGKEAEFKVSGLLHCDATVTVIAPKLSSVLLSWAEEGRFTWLDRGYQHGDLRGAFLVIAERGDPTQNAAIWEEAEAAGALTNVMDDIPHCSFVAGSVVRQGPLVVSISTSGAAPALAVRLRQRLAQELGPEYGTLLEWLQKLRAPMADKHPNFNERRRLWYEIVDSEILDMVRANRIADARRLLAKITRIDPVPVDSTQDNTDAHRSW